MTILQALDQYYGRMAARQEVVAPGYSVEPVGAVIVLAPDGSIISVYRQYDASKKKPRQEIVPKWFGRSGNASTPFFLWDNSAYALGVSNKDAGKTSRDHTAFKELHLRRLSDENDPGLVALREFLLNWRPKQFVAPLFDEKMLAVNFAFRLDGDMNLIHSRPAAQVHIAALRDEGKSEKSAFCLVRGQHLSITRLHPKIKGVDGTASAEVPLVSFEPSASKSYDKERGDNAPTSEDAATRYGAALNRLLDRATSRNRIKIADATAVFWADASGVGEEAANAAEDFFAGLAEPPSDEREAASIHAALEMVTKGRPVEDAYPKLSAGTRFHVLGLAPNAARLSVRFWLTDDFGVFVKALARHYAHISIEPAPWRAKPPSIQRLLVKTTALQEKFENIPPVLSGEMVRAVLAGTAYPRTLLTAALSRLRAGDDPASGWHAAAIKAVLSRTPHQEDIPVSLQRDDPHPAYQLGRLFAALETAQRLALGSKVNATIRDRYFGAASATPANVFPLLLRGVQNHLSKLRKDGKGGWLEREIEEISDRLPPSLPRSLRLEAQGRFVLGYYHQRKGRYADKQAQTEIASIEDLENVNDNH